MRSAQANTIYDPELSPLSIGQLEAAEDALASALHRFDLATAGKVDRSTVADSLITMAEMLTAPVPAAKGIDLFMLAVEDIPGRVWPLAQRHVARTHRFMRMPLPNDYITAAQPYIDRLAAERAKILAPLEAVRAAIPRRKARERRHADA